MRKILWVILLFTACAVDPDLEQASRSFTVTAVELGPDGAKLLSRTEVTAAERDALRAGLEAQPDLPAGGRPSAEIDLDLPCGVASVFLYDEVNFDGNVLCISGVGSMHLSQFVHHLEAKPDLFGTWHLVPVGWHGRAASAWTLFFSADFFQDGSPDAVVGLAPGTGANFLYVVDDILFGYPPDSVTIF